MAIASSGEKYRWTLPVYLLHLENVSTFISLSCEWTDRGWPRREMERPVENTGCQEFILRLIRASHTDALVLDFFTEDSREPTRSTVRIFRTSFDTENRTASRWKNKIRDRRERDEDDTTTRLRVWCCSFSLPGYFTSVPSSCRVEFRRRNWFYVFRNGNSCIERYE